LIARVLAATLLALALELFGCVFGRRQCILAWPFCKVAFVEALAQLHNHFAPGQLWLPEACVSHDEVRPNPHRGGGDCCSRSKEVSMRRPLVPCAFAASQPLCCCCTLTHAYAPSTTAVVPAAR